MAGTRLAVHATFVVELLLLVTAAFLYAATRPHDPAASAEPFLPDRSGRRVLREDASPASSPGEDGGGVVDRMGEVVEWVVHHLNALMGAETERRVPDRPRRASAFVEELRQKAGGTRAPPLRLNLVAPNAESTAGARSLAEAIERGLQGQMRMDDAPRVSVGLAADSASDYAASGNDLCNDIQLSAQSLDGHRRSVKVPEIIIVLGCSTAVPEGRLSSVEVDRASGTLLVRTVLTADQFDGLQRHLEREVSSVLFGVYFVQMATAGERVGSVSIKLIDEDPRSRVSEAGGITAKGHFDVLGRALSSVSQSMIGPMLDDLSLLYGGNIRLDGDTEEPAMELTEGIRLEVASSAYLSLPGDMIERDPGDNETAPENRISSEGLASWAQTHSHQRKGPGGIEWLIVVPSQHHTPAKVYDKSTGEEGESIILSPATLDEERTSAAHPSGVSILNLPSYGDDVDQDKMHQMHLERIQESLAYFVGYIRAIHGLPPSTADLSSTKSTVVLHGEKSRALSFWELESVARSQYHSALELAFSETDAVMALLHQHGGSLAFPSEVAHKLNNSTHLLRQSMALVEEGVPAMYATSLLHGALRYLESVRRDHQFVELPYFAPDHYLAVFSPLVLPLLLPMLVGLIREVKRYRELRKKSVTQQQK